MLSLPYVKSLSSSARSKVKSMTHILVETRLSKRNGDWHERLAPVLEDEENRPEFDIHAYTKRIKSTITENDDESEDGNPIVDFAVVAQENCERCEVCRLFLASLSLSNSRDREIVPFNNPPVARSNHIS